MFWYFVTNVKKTYSMKYPCLFLLLFLCFLSFSQQPTQTVRGSVFDNETKFPLIGAKVVVSSDNFIDKAVTDLEGEFVVENVHNGLRSSFYKAGRFSPSREKGVHHFHRLISEFINN